MRIQICLFILMFACSIIKAEDGKWTVKGMLGASLNQTIVSDNWSGTEKDSRNWMLKLEAAAVKDSAKTNWINTLKEEFGRTEIAGSPEQKSADLFDFSSVYSWKLTRVVNPYVSGAMTTQHEVFLAPVTYTESGGIGFIVIDREKQHLKTRLGAALRQSYDTIKNGVSSIDNPLTVEVETSRIETGAEWVTNYDYLLKQDAKFVSEAKLFTAFKGGSNIRWDNSLYIQLHKIVTMQVGYLLVYNYDKNPTPSWPGGIETRFGVSFGLSYNLF